MKPALVGFSFLALCVAALAIAVPAEQVNPAMWFFVYLALAASSHFTWQHEQAPRDPSEWLKYAALAAVASVFFGAVAYTLHGEPTSSITDFASKNPGVIVEAGIFWLAGLVALAGWARSLAMKMRPAE